MDILLKYMQKVVIACSQVKSFFFFSFFLIKYSLLIVSNLESTFIFA